jgi:hypothetical protein
VPWTTLTPPGPVAGPTAPVTVPIPLPAYVDAANNAAGLQYSYATGASRLALSTAGFTCTGGDPLSAVPLLPVTGPAPTGTGIVYIAVRVEDRFGVGAVTTWVYNGALAAPGAGPAGSSPRALHWQGRPHRDPSPSLDLPAGPSPQADRKWYGGGAPGEGALHLPEGGEAAACRHFGRCSQPEAGPSRGTTDLDPAAVGPGLPMPQAVRSHGAGGARRGLAGHVQALWGRQERSSRLSRGSGRLDHSGIEAPHGVGAPSGRGLIIGGSELSTGAFKADWSFLVSLWILKTNEETKKEGSSFCGGSIISDRVVLTAAHCVYDKVTKRIVLPSKCQVRCFAEYQA